MKILFVDLHYSWNSVVSDGKCPINSLTFMNLASITPGKYEITAIDDPNNINYNIDYTIIAISYITASTEDAYSIADEFRKRGVKIVLGGYHASALPNEAKQHADSVVIGEAEDTWPQLLKDFEKGTMKPFYYQEKPVDLNKLPHPKRNIFNKKSKIAPIQISRGCPVGCEFCAITNMGFRNIHRIKTVKKIINEVESIPHKYLWFCDPSLTVNIKHTKETFKELKKRDKKLMKCNGNVNVLARDNELLKLASDAGCLEWLSGFESISQSSLKGIGKTTNKVKEYKTAVRNVHDYGMMVHGSFVFGFDYDTPDIFERTYELIRTLEIDNPLIQILTPYPGSKLYNRLDKEGRILTKEWKKYNMENVVFQPQNMTIHELEEGANRVLEQLYSTKNIFKRVCRSTKLGRYSFFSTFYSGFYMHKSLK